MEQIQNANELRTAVTLLTANVNNMCNTNEIDEVIKTFCESKDLLINIYKYNVVRLQK